jgi:hypothetical protein
MIGCYVPWTPEYRWRAGREVLLTDAEEKSHTSDESQHLVALSTHQTSFQPLGCIAAIGVGMTLGTVTDNYSVASAAVMVASGNIRLR